MGSAIRLSMNGCCRSCSGALALTMVDLGVMPLANSYVDPRAADEPEARYPLQARVCEECFLVQVADVVPPAQMFADYAYFSSFSDSWVAHARAFARRAVKERNLGQTSLVLEVACNDGYLLRHIAELGVPVLGVEPAENVASAAEELGLEVLREFFGTSLADRLVAEDRRADLVVANNVVAHVPDLHDFIEGLRRVLAPRGAISIEVPHLLRLVEQVAFDTIYHEHFSYFSLHALETALVVHGLRVFDVEELSTHGGSLRVWVGHAAEVMGHTRRVDAVRAAEIGAALTRPEPYEGFAARVATCRSGFRSFLDDLTSAGKSVAAYGAAAKGNTFLNYCEVTTAEVGFVVDRSPHKQGLLLPGSHLPILAPEQLGATKTDYALVLPWNLRDEIVAQVRMIDGWRGQMFIAVPQVEMIG